MRIRNNHPDARLLPHVHATVEPGDTVEWPTGRPVPDGFSRVTTPAASRKKAAPTTPAHAAEE